MRGTLNQVSDFTAVYSILLRYDKIYFSVIIECAVADFGNARRYVDRSKRGIARERISSDSGERAFLADINVCNSEKLLKVFCPISIMLSGTVTSIIAFLANAPVPLSP